MPDESYGFELVAFDVAGTTLSVADEVPAAFRYAFSTVDLGVSDAQVRAVRGVSKREAIGELLSTLTPDPKHDELTRTADAVFSAFKRRLQDAYGRAEVRPVAGAEETFAWLKDRGIAVALTTGFDRDLVHLLLTRVGWTNTLDAVVCDDDVEHGRPEPDLILEAMHRTNTQNVARVVAVGDTTADLQAAQRAGVGLAVGVLSGAHTEEMLRSAPHDAIIGSVAELPAVLRASGRIE